MVNSGGRRRLDDRPGGLLEKLLNGLFPQHCVLCDLPSHHRLPLCAGCAGDLCPNDAACARCALPLPGASGAPRLCGSCLRRPPPFARAVAPWLYEEQLAHIIGRWKYGGDTWLTPLLGALWRRAVPALAPPDRLVPVPLHWRRRWRRGFNQSELLCQQIFTALDRPRGCAIDTRLVRRVRHTPYQSALHAAARQTNLDHAFSVGAPCTNLHIAIVDDVLTTGATAAALATALLAAGAARVELWCLARTPPPAPRALYCPVSPGPQPSAGRVDEVSAP